GPVPHRARHRWGRRRGRPRHPRRRFRQLGERSDDDRARRRARDAPPGFPRLPAADGRADRGRSRGDARRRARRRCAVMRARTLLAVFAVAGLALTVAEDASAWSPIDSRRPTWSGAAPYELNNAGSQDLGFAMTETIVRQGMDDWTRVACTSLTTSY